MSDAWNRQWQAAQLALQFLTRLPVPGPQALNPAALGLSPLYYPLVGLLIGSLMAGAAALAAGWFAAPLTATLLVAGWVLVTGALHIDGLADSADAWVGGQGSRERTLAIMKDPASGPVAVAAVVLVLLLKVAAIAELLEGQALVYLLLAPVLGRLAIPVLFLTTPYVRDSGLGSALLAEFPRRHASALCVAVLVLLLVWSFPIGASVVLVAGAAVMVLRLIMLARLNGCTGDTLGATVELVELAVLLALAAWV